MIDQIEHWHHDVGLLGRGRFVIDHPVARITCCGRPQVILKVEEGSGEKLRIALGEVGNVVVVARGVLVFADGAEFFDAGVDGGCFRQLASGPKHRGCERGGNSADVGIPC